MADNPIRLDILDAVLRAEDEDADGITDKVMEVLDRIPATLALALVSRVHALEEALRRLADAGYAVADHERAYGASITEVVLEGRRLGPDDGVNPLTVGDLRELSEAIAQAEDAFWPTDAIDLAPELLGGTTDA